MRIRNVGSIIEVEDAPVAHWLFSLLFIVVGAIFFLGPLGLFTDYDKLRWWLRIVITFFGAVATGVGVWQLVSSPWSRVRIDPARRRVRLDRVGIRGRASTEWSADAIAAIELLERNDDEGNRIFQLRLFLRDEKPIVLSPVWSHSRERLEAVARTVASAIEVDAVNVRPLATARIVSPS